MDQGKRKLHKSLSHKEWLESAYRLFPERKAQFSSISFHPQPELATPELLGSFDYNEKLGYPGEFPFTRGVYPTMYRGRLWTMRQFAGFGRPEDTNQRFKYLLAHGQTGLSTAFDMPSLMGYDPDDERSRGEVGREGVSIATIEDMERLFEGIDLSSITVSMTINATATVAMALYFAVARRRGISFAQLSGTVQNDMLKEFIAQKEWICPPKHSVKLACDIIEFCAENAPRFNPISISGYHIREAGATAVQELAFTMADAIAYTEHCMERGMAVDDFAPRLSFFFDVHNDFFEEIAKLRAARRLWAHLMRDRFRAQATRSMMLRTHAQTAGVSLTAQQPLNNVARVAIQGLAAVLGGVQSLHTNSMDETLALPSEQAARVALRTQQIIAEETGVPNTIDPLAGSYYVEYLTNKIESEVMDYIKRIDLMGGMLKAIEAGYPQKEIAESAYRFQKEIENGEKIIVGVNAYVEGDDHHIPRHHVDYETEELLIRRVTAFKEARNRSRWLEALRRIRNACEKGQNVMPYLIEGVEAGVTLGEISNTYRDVFGTYKDPGIL